MVLHTFLTELLLVSVLIFYMVTLQKTLQRCSPISRTTSPGNVWLLLIPLFNAVWHFIVVANIAKSLHTEFERRGVPNPEPEPGKTLGLVMCSLIPPLGVLFFLPATICWTIYWIKISGYSSQLQQPFAA